MDKAKTAALVQKAQQGDSEALGQLYEAHYQGIYYFIYMNVKDADLASDLVQDTFEEIIETIGSLNEPAAFVSWSHRIAWHRCTAHFRKHHDVLLSETEDEEGESFNPLENEAETDTDFIPDEALDKKELRQTLLSMIQALPEQQRSAILLHYFTDLSVKEIAQIQDVPENTVKSRLNYGRKSLKDAVETYERKSGVKLRCAGIVPLLLWLFAQTKAEAAAAAAAGTAGGAAAVASTAAKTVGSALGKKIAAGLAALAVTGGAVVALLPGSEPMNWYGHSNLSVANLFDLHSEWFDMELETLTDTEIAGQLTVTKENQTLYQFSFDGVGQPEEGTTNRIHYELEFDEPVTVRLFGEWECTDSQATYDKDSESFYFDSLLLMYEDVQLVRQDSEAVEVFFQNTVWVGEGKDNYPYNRRACQVRLQVDEMTNQTIRGHLTASTQEGIFHETAFTGRGFFHNGQYFYHLSLEVPRQGDSFLGYDSFLMLLYNPADGSLGTLDSFNTEIYNVTFTREP